MWGGSFNSRLLLNLREDKGYSYGVLSSLDSPSTIGADPLDKLVGEYDEEPGSIDDLVYGGAAVAFPSRGKKHGHKSRPR